MTYNVIFRYKEHGKVPEERTQDDPLVLGEGESALIPQTGDHVTYKYGGQATGFEVLSRHFTYFDHRCTVNIEVGRPSMQSPLCLKE
jgi:hypothetical protein